MTSRPAGRCATAWRPVALAVLLAGCGGWVPPPGVGGPRPSAGEWEQRLDAMFASMPEPSAVGAFTFEGEIEFGVPERGKFGLEVTASERHGRPAWHVVQCERHPAFPNGMAAGFERREMWLSRDLRVLASKTTPESSGATPFAGRSLPLAAAILYFRASPAEVTAPADPVAHPVVESVAADGTLVGVCDTADMARAFITLRGPGRTPVKVERFLGWHNMGTIEAREAPK